MKPAGGPHADGAVQPQRAAPSGRAADLAQGAPTGEPEQQTAARDHPQPAGGEFAVEAAVLAEVQIAVELVDPGAQRQRAGGAVLLQGASHLARVRVDEHGEGVGGVYALDAGQHHPGRGVVLRRGADGRNRALGVGLAGGVHLLGDRQRRVADRHGQLVGVHELLGLERGGVQEPGGGGDQQERRHEHACVEVQTQYQRAQRGPRTAGLRRGGRCLRGLVRSPGSSGAGSGGGRGSGGHRGASPGAGGVGRGQRLGGRFSAVTHQ